jgi:hypothetical protein
MGEAFSSRLSDASLIVDPKVGSSRSENKPGRIAIFEYDVRE